MEMNENDGRLPYMYLKKFNYRVAGRVVKADGSNTIAGVNSERRGEEEERLRKKAMDWKEDQESAKHTDSSKWLLKKDFDEVEGRS